MNWVAMFVPHRLGPLLVVEHGLVKRPFKRHICLRALHVLVNRAPRFWILRDVLERAHLVREGETARIKSGWGYCVW